MFRIAGVLLVAHCFLAGTALAETSLVTPTSGYIYFNRPGASLSEHNADLRNCIEPTSRLIQPSTTGGASFAGGPVGYAAQRLVEDIRQTFAERRGAVASIENCMVVHGWRVVRLASRVGRGLAELDQGLIATQLEPMVGAIDPPGEIVREFANEMADARVVLFGPPGDLDKIPLSMLALPSSDVGLNAPPTTQIDGVMPASVFLAELDEEAIPELGVDSTLIVINLAALGGARLRLNRLDGDAKSFASDGRPNTIEASIPRPEFSSFTRPREATLVFEVPPGRWSLTGLGYASWMTSTCLGAPFFEIGEGEVVFFRLNFPEIPRVPTFSDAVAQAALESLPEGIARRARAPDLTNGSSHQCGAASAYYVWEIPGAPFLQDYELGSRHPSLVQRN